MIYLATSLFTAAEQQFGFYVTEKIAELGLQVYYPWRDAGDKKLIKKHKGDFTKVNQAIVQSNLEAIQACDHFIAIAEGADVDSGTAFEVGLASALGKQIWLLRTDFRTQGKNIGPVNIMLSSAAEKHFSKVSELITELQKHKPQQKVTIKHVADFYNAVASEYSNSKQHPTTAKFKKAEQKAVKTILNNKSFPVALDIGCGDGEFLMNVDAKLKIGLDSSVEMLKIHQAKLPQAKYILGDCTDIPLSSRSVTIAHSSFLLDHLNTKQRSKYLKEIHRILDPKGIYILSEYAPEIMHKARKGRQAFDYLSNHGTTYQVPSYFAELANLKQELSKHFKLKKYQRIKVAGTKLAFDLYILKPI